MYRRNEYEVPLSSKCVIHTTGKLRDGDLVSVTSPVFASINFNSGAINMSDKFNVPIKTNDTIVLDDETYGTLYCEDNDTFNMYVRVHQ